MTLFTPTSKWQMEEHQLFTDSVKKFFIDEVKPNLDEWGKKQQVDRTLWNKAGDAGILGSSIPEEFGGFGGDLGFDAITLYELGRTAGDSGSWGYAIQSIVVHYINAYGTDEQKKRWLPKLSTGEYVASLAMTEPSTGSDVQAIKTTAEKDGNQYRINGSKIFITNGGSADLIVLAAKTNKNEKSKGVSSVSYTHLTLPTIYSV